jgi:hypothetical protein
MWGSFLRAILLNFAIVFFSGRRPSSGADTAIRIRRLNPIKLAEICAIAEVAELASGLEPRRAS